MEDLKRSAQLLASDLAYAFGFVWAGLMFASAALFLIEFVVMRGVGSRRHAVA